VELLAAHLRHGYQPPYAARLLADLGDPRAVHVLRDYINEIEAFMPEEGPSRRLRQHYLEMARTALARLDSGS
jgi:hypothetical protein